MRHEVGSILRGKHPRQLEKFNQKRGKKVGGGLQGGLYRRLCHPTQKKVKRG